ncbi:MAG: 30S ribosomal protein S17 [Candidatus Omnitrophica bacterium]|nr:30S ribosomal protein S17 [Candidatus Omnitrophota bacterium]
MSEKQARTGRRRYLQGTVVSDKMDKTRVVQIRSSVKHPKYLKIVRVANKYKAHDENNESKEGDVVRMMETRPLSKDKRWIIKQVVNKAA